MNTLQDNIPADSVVLTATGLASLASSGTLVAGYALAAVSNRVNLDIDHLLSIALKAGTSPTQPTQAQVWVIFGRSLASGTVTWPDCFSSTYSGSAGAFTANSAGALSSAGILAGVLNVDSSTTGRVYEIVEKSIAGLNSGSMPSDWFVFVTHNMVAALDSTGGNFSATYLRKRGTVG